MGGYRNGKNRYFLLCNNRWNTRLLSAGNHGAVYASEHEAYAVLKEEIEEAAEDMEQINRDLAYLWALIKNNHIKNGGGTISEAFDYARMLAQEAVQIAAVCERFLETIK